MLKTHRFLNFTTSYFNYALEIIDIYCSSMVKI